MPLSFVFWSVVPIRSACGALCHVGVLVGEVFRLECRLARTVRKVVYAVSCIGLAVVVGFGLGSPWPLWLFSSISEFRCIRTIGGVRTTLVASFS